MKIRIIGGCGSGKTHIAKILSNTYGIEHAQTDNFVWDRSTNKKNSDELRDQLLSNMVQQSSWIIEGVHYMWTQNSFAEADYIFVIRTHLAVRNWRTLKRFIKTRLKVEERNYTQGMRDLWRMFGWNSKFEKENMWVILKMTEEFKEKRFIVESNTDILTILSNKSGANGRGHQ
ncbi:topology modulation protein [compost metagenome]